MKANLDKLVAESGFNLVEKCKKEKRDLKELERIISKSLGILTEEGLFAYSIWLESEGESIVEEYGMKLIKDAKISQSDKSLRDTIPSETSKDIQKTILTKELLERMLIYARYRAKALREG